MKSPGTPLCGGMAGGGPADLARAPSVPPNISKKSGSLSHKNWCFNFQVNHFVGFCCFLSPLKINIFSSNVASCSLYWNINNMWNLVLSHLVPKLLRWFQKKYEATVCQRKITTNWNIDDRWSEPVLNQNVNDLPILAAQIHIPIHLPYEVIPNITCLLVQSPTRIHGLI